MGRGLIIVGLCVSSFMRQTLLPKESLVHETTVVIVVDHIIIEAVYLRITVDKRPSYRTHGKNTCLCWE